MYILTLLFLLAGICITSWAAAEDLVISCAVFEDKAGDLTISDVVGRKFKPAASTLSKGYTSSAYWLRLQIKAPATSDKVVLFIRQPFLNEIRLYEVDTGAPSGWKSRVTGNYYPYTDRERRKNTMGFIVHPTGTEATYYLRLKTSSVAQMSVEALTPDEAESSDHELDLLEVFFVTAMAILLLWAIYSYAMDRVPVVGLYAVHQATYTLFGIAVTGYLAPYLPAGYPALANFSSGIPYCAVSFTTLLFCRELFKPYEPPRLLMRGMNLLMMVFPLQLAAIAMGFTPLAFTVNVLLIRISWWYFVVMSFTLRKEQFPSRRILQLVFAASTLLFTLFWIASGSQLALTHKLFGRLVLVLNGLMIGSLFAMILHARSRRLLQEAQQSALELKAKSEFLALVSHEIRTPLNALVGFSSLARMTTDTVKLDQYHAMLEQSSQAMMDLLNDILDMSKIEAGRMTVESLPFNMHQLISGLENQYAPLAAQQSLAFNLVVGDDVPEWVTGDAVRVRQVLTNLLSNAVKFTERGTVSCHVALVIPPKYNGTFKIRFEVTDTGTGISEAKRSLLFQPFSQLDPSITRKFGGTGLGLAIAHSLTEMMRGTITVRSEEGSGSCFTVELPFQYAEPVPEIVPESLPESMSAAVLVVEDIRFNRELLRIILTSWGKQVSLAVNGYEALEQVEQQQFGLILLDIRMPGIDGVEVARRIRLREREQSAPVIPIIGITADANTATREACLAAGINVVLTKPVVFSQLARAVRDCGCFITEAHEEDLELNLKTSNDLGNNPERARQYKEMLQQDIDDELQSLQQALEQDNREALDRAAHTLKGLYGHLANIEPAELAAWLQQHASVAGQDELRLVIERLSVINHYRTGKDCMENVP